MKYPFKIRVVTSLEKDNSKNLCCFISNITSSVWLLRTLGIFSLSLQIDISDLTEMKILLYLLNVYVLTVALNSVPGV